MRGLQKCLQNLILIQNYSCRKFNFNHQSNIVFTILKLLYLAFLNIFIRNSVEGDLSLKKEVGYGHGSVSQSCGSGSVQKCHGSGTLLKWKGKNDGRKDGVIYYEN
jgi:hypothetical protein